MSREMRIDDVNEVEEYLQRTKQFFGRIDCERDRLEKELINKELERDDLLHEIELSKLNAIERMSVYSKLETVLKERRTLKDKLEFVNSCRGYTSKFITKGICAETNQALQNIENLKKKHANRSYTPRILKDLKCAKKKEVISSDNC